MPEKQTTNRRDRIVSTARAHFLKQGYEGTKIGHIADALEISKAAVSYYFPTKDSFLDELVEPLVARLESAVETNTDSTWPAGASALLQAYLDALLTDVEIARWVDTDVAVRAEHHFGDRLDGITAGFVSTLTGGSRRVVDRLRALSVLGGIWRPLLELDERQLTRHRDELLAAAMSSYGASAT